MRNFQEKSKFKIFMQSKPTLVILAIILILFAWKVVGIASKLEDTYKNKKIEQQKIIDLKQRKEKLSSDIEKLNTDEGKEEMIRENFGLVKEGEGVVVIVDDKNQLEVLPEKENKGFLSFLKNIFRK